MPSHVDLCETTFAYLLVDVELAYASSACLLGAAGRSITARRHDFLYGLADTTGSPERVTGASGSLSRSRKRRRLRKSHGTVRLGRKWRLSLRRLRRQTALAIRPG